VNSAKNFTIEKGFTENDVQDVDRLFEEFNTLSVVYCQTSDRFLKQFRKLHEQEEPTDSESFRLQQEEFAKRQAERGMGSSEILVLAIVLIGFVLLFYRSLLSWKYEVIAYFLSLA
jgi:hypothetical protein